MELALSSQRNREFYGSISYQMPFLLSGRKERGICDQIIDQIPFLVSAESKKGKIIDVPRTPASFAYILERRETAPEDLRSAWQVEICTGDAVASGEHGDIVSVWDSPYLRNLTCKSKLINGALKLTTDQFEEMKAQKEGTLYLTAEDVSKANYKGFVCRKGVLVPANKIVGKVWDHLARGRNLQTYAQMVYDFSQSKLAKMHLYCRHCWSYHTMNLSFGNFHERELSLMSWVAATMNYNSSTSGNQLNDVYVRMVGVAPETSVAAGTALEARIQSTLILTERVGRPSMSPHNG